VLGIEVLRDRERPAEGADRELRALKGTDGRVGERPHALGVEVVVEDGGDEVVHASRADGLRAHGPIHDDPHAAALPEIADVLAIGQGQSCRCVSSTVHPPRFTDSGKICRQRTARHERRVYSAADEHTVASALREVRDGNADSATCPEPGSNPRPFG
jgi:hypothetical protein